MEAAIIPVIIGLITAFIGAISSESANATNVELTRETNRSNQQIQTETNDLQRQLAANANAWSLQQWIRENNYNTPTSQMERLRSAGVNPALAYSHGGLVNEAASSPAVNMANVNAVRNIAPHVERVATPDPLTAAQIANLDADSEQKRANAQLASEQKRGQAISNALENINLITWQTLDKDGLIEQAKRAGLEQDIMSSDLTSYQLFEAAWDFLIYTGYPDERMTGKYGAGSIINSIFTYDPERLKKAQEEFVGTQAANIAVQKAAQTLANKQKEFNSNSGEIMADINASAAKGELWAKIVKVALFILEQRSGQPGISLNFSPSRSKVYDNSSHYDQSDRNTKVFNAPFK